MNFRGGVAHLYPVSDAFMEAVCKNTRRYYWTGTIDTKNRCHYEFGNDDIVKGSGYITKQCCGSTEIEIGTVYAAELGITIYSTIDRYTLDDAAVRLYYHLVLADGTEETVPMGVFEVSEANRTTKCLELKAYDYMLRFDKAASVDMSSATPFEFLMYACGKCNVELAHSQEEVEAMPNGKELLGIYPDGNIETYRDLLFYLAQILGRVCQINREGKLELMAYGNEPVVSVGAEHRFSSSYSDFVTKYTAVYSTNEVDAKSEYYCMEPDDGLTMNLGVNPLLQYGLQNSRESIIRNILDCISVIGYVPFDSDTIGNPALDPMDVICFNGGHADPDSVSCITSVTYKINGKQGLKGVGKNPRLSSAKSKADKNIMGLLNQVESSKFVICAYENATVFEIGESPARIIDMTFASIESTSALFIGNVNCEVMAEEEKVEEVFLVRHEAPTVESIINRAVALAKQANGETAEDTVAVMGAADIPEVEYEAVEEIVAATVIKKKCPTITFLYKVDDNWVAEYSPKQKVMDGGNIFPLLYPMGTLGVNSAKTIEVYMKAEGGTVTIFPANCKASVAGSGIAGGYTEWDGKIVIEEYADIFILKKTDMSMIRLAEDVAVRTMNETIHGFSDSVRLMKLDNEMKLSGLSDRDVSIDLV